MGNMPSSSHTKFSMRKQSQSHISSWDCGWQLWMMIYHLFPTGGLVELKRIPLQYLGNLFNQLIPLFQHSNPTPLYISLIVSSSSHWQQVYSNISVRQTSKIYLNSVLYPPPHIPSGSDQSNQILTILIKFRPFRPNSDQIPSRKSLF